MQLGVDSLLVVDMRAWFTKELDLEMPILKILGGATVYDLVDDAMTRLAPELVPNLAGSVGETNAAADSGVQEQQQFSEVKGPSAEEVAEIEAENNEASWSYAVEQEEREEQEMAIMAPINLLPFEDHQPSIEVYEASAGAQTSKYPSTIAGDLEKVYQRPDTTQPTSRSEASSDYVKSELEGKHWRQPPGKLCREDDRVVWNIAALVPDATSTGSYYIQPAMPRQVDWAHPFRRHRSLHSRGRQPS